MKLKRAKCCCRAKKLCVKAVKHCTMCGKRLDIFDEQEDFSIQKTIGYGSHYDGSKISLQLCCDCFDKVIDSIAPLCRTNPITDPYEEWADTENSVEK